jgi:signal transduction histidine kinase
MRDRVTELGGLLTVDSMPGDGTRVRAWFPLPAASLTGEAVPGEAVSREAVAGETVTGEAR